MKLAVVQKNISNTDLDGFLKQAKIDESELVCFGELATTGCVYEPHEIEPIEKLTRTLEQYDMDIFCGVAMLGEDKPFNTYLHYCHGIKHLYHKVNLFEPFNELNVYRAGETPGIWETDFGRTGIATCYDLRFDNLFEQFAKAEVDLVFVPAAWPRVRVARYRELLSERAQQTNAHVIGINAVGNDGTNEFGGSSSVVSPDGEVLMQADEVTETILEIDL